MEIGKQPSNAERRRASLFASSSPAAVTTAASLPVAVVRWSASGLRRSWITERIVLVCPPEPACPQDGRHRSRRSAGQRVADYEDRGGSALHRGEHVIEKL